MGRLYRFIKKYEFPIHLHTGWAVFASRVSSAWGTFCAKLHLKSLGCLVEQGFCVDGRLWIWAQKKRAISIGKRVRINSRFGSNLVGLTNPAVFQCIEGGTISIGDHVGMSSVVLSARSGISIGNHTKLGGNVRVFDHDYHALDHMARRVASRDGAETRSRPVVIGDDVFIGSNAIILKGVSIGDRSIVQAGAVVTCDIPSDEIWGGNPAVKLSEKKN